MRTTLVASTRAVVAVLLKRWCSTMEREEKKEEAERRGKPSEHPIWSPPFITRSFLARAVLGGSRCTEHPTPTTPLFCEQN